MGGSASEVPGLPRTKRRTPPRAPTEPEPAHPPLRSRGLEGWAPQTASTREGGGGPRPLPEAFLSESQQWTRDWLGEGRHTP